ncbi:MAG: DUF177 domain-containing protein [Candidatus Aminicenantes bacterium]|jgi:uncharacterized protein
MYIDINRISPKGLLLEDRVELQDHLLIEEESFFLDAVDFSVYFTREKEKIRARGKIRTALSLRCVNCLENYELKVNSKFDIILFPVYLVKSTDTALTIDEMEYIFFDGEEIDLEKILMEQVNLFIPFNPICTTDCRGICPNCGVNLNYEECQCEHPLTEMSLLFNRLKR